MKMRKRWMSILLALCLSVSMIYPVSAGGIAGELPEEAAQETAAPADASALEVPARSYILLESNTGTVITEKDADVQMPPASITKIMTLLLVMEAVDSGKISMEDTVTASEHASSMGGSQIWLKEGEQMALTDVLKAAVVSSANDASVALAEHVAGSEESFVNLMNERAAQLGMKNTVFHNATGLDAEGHVSSARDIAIMAQELLKHPRILDYTTIWMDSLRGGATELVNTNKLIRFYEGATGLKTGTTEDAGYCLCATAERGGESLVAVVMGCTTTADRFSAARKLLDFGFANYTVFDPSSLELSLEPVPVKQGTAGQVECELGQMQPVLLKKGQEKEVTTRVNLPADVLAPVEQGQSLGSVELLHGEEKIGEYPIIAKTAVQKMTFSHAFFKILGIASSMNQSA